MKQRHGKFTYEFEDLDLPHRVTISGSGYFRAVFELQDGRVCEVEHEPRMDSTTSGPRWLREARTAADQILGV